ncbi:MAG: hypothetical protein LBH06_09270 [Rikenellaceae bacterium]|nr:hypothetical protein [Rikenellaceae bacterium]
MEEIKKISDAIYTIAGNDIVARKRNPVVAILIMLAGVAAVVVGNITESVHGNSGIVVAGGVVAVFGLARAAALMVGKGSAYYRPTGERLLRSKLMFDQQHEARVMEAIAKGDSQRRFCSPRRAFRPANVARDARSVATTERRDRRRAALRLRAPFLPPLVGGLLLPKG